MQLWTRRVVVSVHEIENAFHKSDYSEFPTTLESGKPKFLDAVQRHFWKSIPAIHSVY